ncbi:ATP-binding protein [Mycobacterium asiaticum DSM 44297]|nr:ATP-binding protein [Mycobacterium asiaticum DSM 44297]
MAMLAAMSREVPPVDRVGGSSFAVHLAAAPEHIATFRHELRHWLQGLTLKPAQMHDILLAAGEAVTNAIEHGSRSDATQSVSVEAALHRETVTVVVSDGGRWIESTNAPLTPTQHRGRGLFLMEGLADRLAIDGTDHGTRVTMHFDVPAAAGRRTGARLSEPREC